MQREWTYSIARLNCWGSQMSVFSSIILRFRDLSTPAGTTTIEEHKKIISERRYVWWGWWRKQGETVPEQAFRDILAAIGRTGGYEIYLFDSGKYKLHRARIVDIQWDSKLTQIATPERDATPNYYGDAHYLAWFKLGLIEDPVLTPADLQAWSYVRVNEFFETKKSAKQKLMRLWARVPKSSRSFRHCNLLPTRHPRRDWPNGRI